MNIKNNNIIYWWDDNTIHNKLDLVGVILLSIVAVSFVTLGYLINRKKENWE